MIRQLTPPPLASPPRRGFTLVEMMVAIAIVAVIASFVLSAMYAAQEAARERKTQVLINKINQEVMRRWEDYQYRRIPIDAVWLAEYGSTGLSGDLIDTPTGMRNLHAIQLGAKRELMRMEMPDKYEDLFFGPTLLIDASTGNAVLSSLRTAYHAQIESRKPATLPFNDYLLQIRESHESAEMLHLILTTTHSGEAIFNERDFGDVDGDGMPEFVDGWGNPIEWIRWPAGFFSDLQPGDPELADPAFAATGIRNADHIAANPDPDDSWLVDEDLANAEYARETSIPIPRGYRLVPLIVSAGRDGSFGLAFRWRHNSDAARDNDPYAVTEHHDTGMLAQRGRLQNEPGERADLDNIHNHLLSGLE